MRAAWFRRRNRVLIACTGVLWDYQTPTPQDAAEFLRRHDDGRYGGDCQDAGTASDTGAHSCPRPSKPTCVTAADARRLPRGTRRTQRVVALLARGIIRFEPATGQEGRFDEHHRGCGRVAHDIYDGKACAVCEERFTVAELSPSPGSCCF
jgi:hypothetical protein